LHLDLASGVKPPSTEMICSLPPHRQTLSFTSYDEYEVHYNKTHVNRCLKCRRNFPTTHFLNLHIEENHDALVSVKKERGERTYSCFVEDCDRKCSTPQKRRMHLVDKHLFPKDYDFYIVNDGIDHRTSMLRSGRHRRKSSAAQHVADNGGTVGQRNSTREPASVTEAEDIVEQTKNGPVGLPEPMVASSSNPRGEDTDMEGLTGAMSSLKFVPPSVRFGRGRGRGRGGFSRT